MFTLKVMFRILRRLNKANQKSPFTIEIHLIHTLLQDLFS